MRQLLREYYNALLVLPYEPMLYVLFFMILSNDSRTMLAKVLSVVGIVVTLPVMQVWWRHLKTRL